MTTFQYVGTELDIFAHAINWKSYWSSLILPYLNGDILEVGAGLGSNTALLKTQRATSWLCLEPDPALAARLSDLVASHSALSDVSVRAQTTASLNQNQRFDAIIYIDVLEHIEDDRGELSRAARLLKPDGRIIVLSPAHQWLYTPFDQAIGHFRRYSRGSLAAASPAGCVLERLSYLDAVGMLASIANRLFLKQSMPTLEQIRVWDRFLVPPSRLLDPLTFHRLGKSILGIWRALEAPVRT